MIDYPLLIEARGGIKGLFYYGSSYSCSAFGLGSRMHAQIRRVYNFKKWHQNADLIGELVRKAAERLECSEIWAIPSSTAGKVNALQSVFGTQIERMADAVMRKYNHHLQVDVSGLKYPEKASGTVLLIDDISTTGRTLLAVAMELARRNISCKMFAVGISRKIVTASSPSPEAIEDAFREWKQEWNREELTDAPLEEGGEQNGLGNFDVTALLNSISGTLEADDDDFEDRIVMMAEDETFLPEQRLRNIIELVKARQQEVNHG